MPEAPDTPPSRYREPWAPHGRPVLRSVRRRCLPIVIALATLAAADQAVVRTHRAPECVTCLASFEETEWRLCLPWHDSGVPLTIVRSELTESPAAEWVAPSHEHIAQTAASSDVRGVLVARDDGSAEAAFPERLPGAFVIELEAEPAFGEFLREAVARGDADPADLAEAVEIFNDVECGPLTPAGPPDPRILEITNELWTEWREESLPDAHLWGDRGGD